EANTVVEGNAEQKGKENLNPKGEERLEGLCISMVTTEPFRSGIAANITAQVLEDVKDTQGRVVVPAGSTCKVPFLPFEVGGRVTNDSSARAIITLPGG